MPTWLVVAIMLVATALAGAGYFWRVKKNDNDPANKLADEEAPERYKARCAEGESVIVICRAAAKGSYYYVLTDRRLIIDTKSKQANVDLYDIKKIKMQGFGAYGTSKTTSVDDCISLTINTNNSGSYTLNRFSKDFTTLARELQSRAPSK